MRISYDLVFNKYFHDRIEDVTLDEFKRMMMKWRECGLWFARGRIELYDEMPDRPDEDVKMLLESIARSLGIPAEVKKNEPLDLFYLPVSTISHKNISISVTAFRGYRIVRTRRGLKGEDVVSLMIDVDVHEDTRVDTIEDIVCGIVEKISDIITVYKI